MTDKQARSLDDTEDGQINASLCDDVLWAILGAHIDPWWRPAAARVCRRWYAILSRANRRSQSVATIKMAMIASGRTHGKASKMVPWALRTHALACKAGPAFIHHGHMLIGAAAPDVSPSFLLWACAERTARQVGRTRRRHGRSGDVNDAAIRFFYDPDCGADAMDRLVWRCAARAGKIAMLCHAMVTGHEWQQPHRAAVLGCIASDRANDLVRHADVDLLRRLADRGLVDPRVLWASAARSNRVDVMGWLASLPSRCIHNTKFWCACEREKRARELFVEAAAGDGVAALDWIASSLEPGSNRHYCVEMFDAALGKGALCALDWLERHCGTMALSIRDMSHALSAVKATAPSALEWLCAREATLPASLVSDNIPGSVATLAYAVDIGGCHPPTTDALTLWTRRGRFELVAEATRRGWVPDHVRTDLWAKAIGIGDGRIASIVGIDMPYNTPPYDKPPFGVECGQPGDDEIPALDFYALRRYWGCEWNATVIDDVPAPAVLWALDDGCPMPWQWYEAVSIKEAMGACALATVLGQPGISHDHPIDQYGTEPLDGWVPRHICAVVRAHAHVRCLVRQLAPLWEADRPDALRDLYKGFFSSHALHNLEPGIRPKRHN
jgi:hypothetical protein